MSFYLKMAVRRLVVWNVSAVPWSKNSLVGPGVLQTHLLIPNRGKKVQKKRNMKGTVKNSKDFALKREVERLLRMACEKTAKRGEPLDPEMLNPERMRRPPEISEEEKERRVLLLKQWQKLTTMKHRDEHKLLHEAMVTRRKALQELKKVSLPLYHKAMELQPNLFPLDWHGPTTTPPIPGYQPPEPDE